MSDEAKETKEGGEEAEKTPTAGDLVSAVRDAAKGHLTKKDGSTIRWLVGVVVLQLGTSIGLSPTTRDVKEGNERVAAKLDEAIGALHEVKAIVSQHDTKIAHIEGNVEVLTHIFVGVEPKRVPTMESTPTAVVNPPSHQ